MLHIGGSIKRLNIFYIKFLLGVIASFGALFARVTYKPGVHFKQKKDVLNMQPYEGDILVEIN